MKKAALHNLGCKVNAYETEAMQEMLEKAGYEIVPFKEGADLYVINTCTVTNRHLLCIPNCAVLLSSFISTSFFLLSR